MKIKYKPVTSQCILLDNKTELWYQSYKIEIFSSFFSYRFLPERAIAAINHLQNIQFEAVVGHKTKMK